MARILQRFELVPGIHQMVVEAPQIAQKALPGHFVIVMSDEKGERIPLTIADSNSQKGTITLVIMVIGTTTNKLAKLNEGESLQALIGPLGHPSEIEDFGTVVMVAGGVGTAPVYPIAKALKERGNKIISIQGARSEDLLFWEDMMGGVSDELIITTDDGSKGQKALVTAPLKELLEKDTKKEIGCVYAIGPAIMMKACSETTRSFGVKTIVSLNSIMIDGTGMCGGCRVVIGDKTRFTCADGPEFDGHEVNWDSVLSRAKIYVAEEKCSLDRYIEENPQ